MRVFSSSFFPHGLRQEPRTSPRIRQRVPELTCGRQDRGGQQAGPCALGLRGPRRPDGGPSPAGPGRAAGAGAEARPAALQRVVRVPVPGDQRGRRRHGLQPRADPGRAQRVVHRHARARHAVPPLDRDPGLPGGPGGPQRLRRAGVVQHDGRARREGGRGMEAHPEEGGQRRKGGG